MSENRDTLDRIRRRRNGHVTFAEKVAAIRRSGVKPRTPGETEEEAARKIAGAMVKREGKR